MDANGFFWGQIIDGQEDRVWVVGWRLWVAQMRQGATAGEWT